MSSSYFQTRNGSAPVVVQGQIVDANRSKYDTKNTPLVSSDYQPAPLEIASAHDSDTLPRGKQKTRQCRDFIWAILFYVHLGLIAFCTARFVPVMVQDVGANFAGRRALQNNNNNAANGNFSVDPHTVMLILAVSGVAGFVLSSLAMLLLRFAEGLVKVALIFNLVVAAAMAIGSLVAGVWGMSIMFGVGMLFSIYYCYIVWPKIPFAASNLITATTAVRSNMGLAFFAYFNLILTFLWSFWWAVTFVSASYVLGDCNAQGNCNNQINGGLVFAFLVSYFWAAQVIKNVVHTTVAGTVGTFWFHPIEANGCCSKAVRDSYWRSITTSFGSICLGSLIVALIQATREIVHSIREQGDSILACVGDCLLGCIESLVEYFNQWAYVYVGLYGYGFVEAGKNVMTLFRSRGWSSIIADMLVDTVLLMVSLGVGVLTGLIGLLIGSLSQQDTATLAGSFFIGFVIGFVLCSTLFSLISSAVNATIVLYAEAPAEFQANHPQLSEQMRAAWKQAYPQEFQY